MTRRTRRDSRRAPQDIDRQAPAVHAALNRLAEERATGALRVGSEGAFFLTEGAVTFAESTRTTNLDSLVTSAGVVSPSAWHRARDGASRPVNPAAIVSGRPDVAELEMVILLAIFDAAYFLLSSQTTPEFTPGSAHWLAPVRPITPATLAHETDRRRALLDSTWSSSAADDAPVTPVRRLRRQRVVLTGLQAEILLNADGGRTPVELARCLGRTGFGCLLAVRALSAAALVRTSPGQEAPAKPEGPAAPPPPQRPLHPEEPSAPALPRRRRVSPDPEPARAGRTSDTVVEPGRPEGAAVDRELLIWIRDSLKRLI